MFGSKNRTKEEVRGSKTISKVNARMDELQATLNDAVESSPAPRTVTTSHDVHATVIGPGTVIEGHLTAEGDLRVEGTVKGDVTTRTSLIVGEKAIVDGNIVADQAEIAGRVNGTVKALGLLIIRSSSTIVGDVITKDLNVESGSSFNGRFQVGTNSQPEAPKVLKAAARPAATPAAPSVDQPKADSKSVMGGILS